GVTGPGRAAVGIVEGLPSLEVIGIAVEIPGFAVGADGLIDFVGSAEVGGEIVDVPRRATLHQEDGIEGPSVDQLATSLLSRNQVSDRGGEMVADVEHAIPVDGFLIGAVDGDEETPVVGI